MKAVRTGLFAAVVGMVLTAINPWGLNEVSGRAAQDVVQRLTADAYPIGARKPVGDRGEDLVTVVSIDEAGVQALADAGWTGWPPGLENLATMITDVALNSGPTREQAAAARPTCSPQSTAPPCVFRGARAVFADFWVDGPVERQWDQTPTPQHAAFQTFLDELGRVTRSDVWSGVPECRTDPAMQIACIVSAGGVPVIMAQARGGEAAAQVGLRPIALTATNAARLGAVVVLSPVTVDDLGTPLIGVRDADAGQFTLAPPAALWLASCLSRINEGGTCSLKAAPDMLSRARLAIAAASEPNRDPPAPPLPRYDALAPLEALWPAPQLAVWTGRKPDHQLRLEHQTSSSQAPECRAQTPFWDRLAMAVTGRVIERGADRACMPQRVIEYDRLVSGAGLPQEDYDLLLKDRLVLIGSHFDGPDWIGSPIHGRVPGVHWHAMALDNLLEKDGDYRRSDPGFWTISTGVEAVLTFVVTALIALLIGLAEARDAATGPKSRWRHPWMLTAIGLSVCLASAIVVLILIHFVWSPWPINWVAVLSVCIGAMATMVEGAVSGRIAVRFRKGVHEPLTHIGEAVWRRLRRPPSDPAHVVMPPSAAPPVDVSPDVVSPEPFQNRAP